MRGQDSWTAPSSEVVGTAATTNAGDSTQTQYVTETIVQTVLIPVTAPIPRPTSPPNSTSIGTVNTVGTIASLVGTAPFNVTPVGNVSFTRSPPSIRSPVISGGKSLSQRAWSSIMVLATTFSVLSF
ncbi:hypothetical protein O1611_g10181 [Lasiodiplodia mahajangana]|uniref:Uncharacterized protein n=1 Tax=Lasiodiplodia mahajangana TaxID=1108764 RepID=A0ACC2J104_9PEZI|nr:hypothetical protein O1611_g10181 [Lasiodiplodia mahajangana]